MLASLIRIALRFAGLSVNALIFALAARVLTPQQMGVWALATALTSVIMSLDLGIASDARNRMGPTHAQSQATYTQAVSMTAVVAGCYACMVLAAAGGLHAWGLSALAMSDVQRAAFGSVVGAALILLVRMPFNLASSTFYSFHESSFPMYWECASFLMSLSFVALALWAKASVEVVVLAYLAGSLLAAAGASVHFCRRRGWRYRWAWPSSAMAVLRGPARNFGVLQVFSLGLNLLPGFLIAALVAVEDVTSARAAMILCQAILSLHLAHAMPIWTEVSSLVRAPSGEVGVGHLRKRLRREMLLLLAPFSVLALVAPWAIDFWLGREHANGWVTLAFCVWGWGCGVANVYSLVLNGAGRPLRTAFAMAMGSMAALAASFVLSRQGGSAGVAAAFAVGALLAAYVMCRQAGRILGSLEQQAASAAA